MELIDEPLPGVRIFKPFVFRDNRGEFVKSYHEGQLAIHGIAMTVREEFFSISSAGVIRGMHFQIPPHAHQKLVYCISGKVTDVLLDLRRGLPTYGKAVAFELSETNRHLVHIPEGIAHGFRSLADNSCLIYKTDVVHHPESDSGIRWDSFGFEWGETSSSGISQRDLLHPAFADFESPF